MIIFLFLCNTLCIIPAFINKNLNLRHNISVDPSKLYQAENFRLHSKKTNSRNQRKVKQYLGLSEDGLVSMSSQDGRQPV